MEEVLDEADRRTRKNYQGKKIKKKLEEVRVVIAFVFPTCAMSMITFVFPTSAMSVMAWFVDIHFLFWRARRALQSPAY